MLQRRFLNLERVQAWNTWVGHTDEARRQAKLMARCLRRATSAKLHGAWDQWSAQAHEWRFLRGIVGKAVHAGLNKGFNSWLELLEELETMRQVVRVRSLAAERAERLSCYAPIRVAWHLGCNA